MKKLGFDSFGRLRSGFIIFFAFAIFSLATILESVTTSIFVQFGIYGTFPTAVGALLKIIVMCVLTAQLFKHGFAGQYFESMDCFGKGSKAKAFVHLLQGLFWGLFFFVLTVAPLYLSGEYSLSWSDLGPKDAANYILALLANYIGVGVCEELMTRGGMLHALLRFGKWKALFISSSIFAVLHLLNDNITFLSVLNIALAGLIMGMSMYATKSIMVAIGFHITWNWIQGAILGIPVSGGAAYGGLFQTTIEGTKDWITGGLFGAEGSIYCTIVLALGSLAFFLYGRSRGSFEAFEDRPFLLQSKDDAKLGDSLSEER